MTTLKTIQNICWRQAPLAVGVFCFLINVRRDSSNGSRKKNRSGGFTLDFLDRRYASGEIGP